MRLVLASNNAKKLVELRALMAGLPVALVAQGDLAVGEAAEPFHTFVENALTKARHAARPLDVRRWQTIRACVSMRSAEIRAWRLPTMPGW